MQKPEKKQPRQLSLGMRNTLIGYSFIAPNFIGFLVLILFPVLFTFWLCFNKWNGFTPMEFVGLQNFAYIFKDKNFRPAMWKTLSIPCAAWASPPPFPSAWRCC